MKKLLIISLILSSVLAYPIDFSRPRKIVGATLVLGGIWSFAVITALHDEVKRGGDAMYAFKQQQALNRIAMINNAKRTSDQVDADRLCDAAYSTHLAFIEKENWDLVKLQACFMGIGVVASGAGLYLMRD